MNYMSIEMMQIGYIDIYTIIIDCALFRISSKNRLPKLSRTAY